MLKSGRVIGCSSELDGSGIFFTSRVVDEGVLDFSALVRDGGLSEGRVGVTDALGVAGLGSFGLPTRAGSLPLLPWTLSLALPWAWHSETASWRIFSLSSLLAGA